MARAVAAAECDFLRWTRALVPRISWAGRHKGSSGRLAVLGGSRKYTGAPYFAGVSALRTGADLCSILCVPAAAVAIKSYHPDLMVDPVLDETAGCCPSDPAEDGDASVDRCFGHIREEHLGRLSALVCGPGLGLESFNQAVCRRVIAFARDQGLPLVLDGDAIRSAQALLEADPGAFRGYTGCVLTPNAMEFRRLWQSAFSMDQPPPPFDVAEEDPRARDQLFEPFAAEAPGDNLPRHSGTLQLDDPCAVATVRLAQKLGGPTIVRKGLIDVISDGRYAVYCGKQGSPRRCGGQGDILSGITGTILGWFEKLGSGDAKLPLPAEGPLDDGKVDPKSRDPPVPLPVLAAWASCYLSRCASELAFQELGVSVMASDIVGLLPQIISKQLYPSLRLP